MLDLFGREVKRGDIIAYGVIQLSGFNKFSETRLGVVSHVLPAGRKYIVKDRNTRKALLDSNGNKCYQDTIEKITYYPLTQDILNPFNVKLTKNGKRKLNPNLSMKFLIVSKSDIDETTDKIYNEVCRQFKIC